MSQKNSINSFDVLELEGQLSYALKHAESSVDTHEAFMQKISKGGLVESEDADSHIVVYFIPYDADKKKVLLVHNIATGLWLGPAGHVQDGENLTDAVKREANEELGLSVVQVKLPFLLTMTKPTSKKRPCKQHFDVWFVIEVKAQEIVVDKGEASDFRWRHLDAASKGVTDPATIVAIETLKKQCLFS